MSTISDVLKALDRDGFYPALRTLERVEGIEREKRLLAAAYARKVWGLMTDWPIMRASATAREWQESEVRRVCECIEAGTDPYPYPRGES